MNIFLGSAGDWTGQLQYQNSSATRFTIVQQNYTTASNWGNFRLSINALLNSAAESLLYWGQENSGTSTFYGGCILNYRLVG